MRKARTANSQVQADPNRTLQTTQVPVWVTTPACSRTAGRRTARRRCCRACPASALLPTEVKVSAQTRLSRLVVAQTLFERRDPEEEAAFSHRREELCRPRPQPALRGRPRLSPGVLLQQWAGQSRAAERCGFDHQSGDGGRRLIGVRVSTHHRRPDALETSRPYACPPRLRNRPPVSFPWLLIALISTKRS